MLNLVNNFKNYLYSEEQAREKSSAIEITFIRYLHQFFISKSNRELKLKILFF